jgi:hypothetical protein
MANRQTLPIYHVAFDEYNIQHFLSFYDLLELTGNQNRKTGELLPLTDIDKLTGTDRLTRETFVWRKGMDEWKRAKYVPELKPLFAFPPDVPKELKELVDLPDFIGTETIAEAITREATHND